MTDAFREKVAIVTGGTSGIGLGLCEELLRRGAFVYVVGSRESSVAKAREQFSRYPNARYAVVDVRDNAAVEKVVDDCVAEFGRLDYMFNNAGISQSFPYERATLEIWKDMIDTNLWGVIYGVNAALRVMKEQGGGQIVNTSSFAALFCTPYQPVYAATKSAVIALTRSLRYEYEPQNIIFTVICPGNVATPIFEGNIPPDAITVEEAVRIILDGVSKKELMIVFPEYYANLYEMCKDPAVSDKAMKMHAAEKREYFRQSPE
ncbi:MAG: SDR family oxidoreductase [Methanoculleus sp.]